MIGSKLTSLFVDMDAYFAQVEQRVQPNLRGVPIGIVPVLTDSTCCIAASYEAKRRGVKTGMPVREAKKICPELRLVESRPELYIRFHHRIIEAVDTCIPVSRVLSIDEMVCRLAANERSPTQATDLARRVKSTVWNAIGLTCSVGVAPNETLAKVASDMDKPDGLVVLLPQELPDRLFDLPLSDLPGVGPRMLLRLHAHNVRTIEEMCALSESKLVEIWRSVEGRRWWLRLRGEDVPPVRTRRRSIGHQRILPPALRTTDAARVMLIHLICKAAARARQADCSATKLTVGLRLLPQGRWKAGASFEPTQDTRALITTFLDLWPDAPLATPIQVEATLQDLVPLALVEQPLFDKERSDIALWRAIDRINTKHGKHMVHLAALHDTLAAVPVRIPFSSIPDLDLPA